MTTIIQSPASRTTSQTPAESPTRSRSSESAPSSYSPSAAASAAATSRYSRASTDAFGDYLRRIGKGPLLSAEDEVDLARKIEVGLFAEEKMNRAAADGVTIVPELKRELTTLVFEGRRAKNHFIEANLRLVV
ncbi:MAG: sigma-70 factor domain-containing protein, partial [Cryobacterium sp.]